MYFNNSFYHDKSDLILINAGNQTEQYNEKFAEKAWSNRETTKGNQESVSFLTRRQYRVSAEFVEGKL